MLSRTASAAIAALLAMGFTACGDDEDEESTSTTAAPTAQGSPTVSIDMVDYAFLVSGPLTAGGTLKLSNSGSEFHMIGIAKFKPGKTLADLQRVLSEQGPPGGGAPSTTLAGSTTTSARGATTTTAGGSSTTTAAGGGQDEDPTAEIVDDVGLPGSFMGPGESAEVMVPNLQPGTYALVCFIPTEVEGTPHFGKGMVGQLEVVAGATPPAPTADATYKVAPGKAVEGPATLTAGRHVLKFEAAPGSEQLEPGVARLNPGATIERLDAALNDLFESEEPPAKGAASRVPGQIVWGGFDLEGVTSFYLTVDFKPGNYVIVAEDTDDEGTPGPPKEVISVKVG